jgi:thiol-disulfide isomerase/thioredoxin
MQYQQGYQRKASKMRAQALWADLVRDPEGFAEWWKRPEPGTPPVHVIVWAAKDQPLTKLNAPDLSGKTWTIADLKGKRTLINIWATWCGPCREELPSVQKLYEQVKDLKDVQVVTIDVDEDPGLLDAFVKAQHYTFPILLAKSLVDDLAPEMAIPRNWIVNGEGTLKQEGLGFYRDDWPDKVLKLLRGAQ